MNITVISAKLWLQIGVVIIGLPTQEASRKEDNTQKWFLEMLSWIICVIHKFKALNYIALLA